jgi:hypothetical protein
MQLLVLQSNVNGTLTAYIGGKSIGSFSLDRIRGHGSTVIHHALGIFTFATNISSRQGKVSLLRNDVCHILQEVQDNTWEIPTFTTKRDKRLLLEGVSR